MIFVLLPIQTPNSQTSYQDAYEEVKIALKY